MLSDKGEEYLRAMLDDLTDPTRRLGGGETRAERKARIAAHSQLRAGLSRQEQREVFRALRQHMDRLRQDKKAARHGVRLRALGVIVKDGEVRTPTRRLGDLAGAEAQVTDGARVARVGAAAAATALLGPAGMLAALSEKSRVHAFVIFADNTFYERVVDGNANVRLAQAECVRFNLLAAGGGS